MVSLTLENFAAVMGLICTFQFYKIVCKRVVCFHSMIVELNGEKSTTVIISVLIPATGSRGKG